MADVEEMDQQAEDRLLADNGEAMETQEGADEEEVNGRSEDFHKLIELGIDSKVAVEVDKIYQSGKLEHLDLDERALDALKEFSAEDAIAVLKEFNESSLEHVTNKSAFLCSVMKTYRQRNKSQGSAKPIKGADEAKIKEILDRTGYSLEVTTGQHKYGGPPPNWDQPQPGAGHEVFCGKVPKDIYEDELIPLFEKCGEIWDLRLMMDPVNGCNRGYCFVTFCQRSSAKDSVKQLDNYEIRTGKFLKVNVSVANLRLFVGNIPKMKTKEEIQEEFSKKTVGLLDVIIYSTADEPRKRNRGFAFLEYDTHKNASTAKRKLSSGRMKVWGCDILVDWADPMEEPDDDTMDKVKVLYVRNLTSEVTEEVMEEKFGAFGKVERVKKIKDYAFVHFEDRDSAVAAMEGLNAQKMGKNEIEVSLAKPPTDNKKKEQRKRDQERRQMGQMFNMRGGYDDYWGPPGRMMHSPGRGMRGGRPSGPPRGGYDPYYEDYYGFEDFDYYGGYAPFGPRGRGGRGGPAMPPPMRGRGGIRGRGGPAGGARGRGGRGGRGVGMRGRGSSQPRGGASGGLNRGGKRKAGGDYSFGQPKRRNMQDNWGAQPIAQQPLDQLGYGGGYGGNDSQWYQDSYGQNW